MLSKKRIIAFLMVVLSAGTVFAGLEQDWNDFLHYTTIGRFDLAKGYGQKIIDSNPDAKEVFSLSRANPDGYRILIRMNETSEELKEVSGKIIELINRGRYELRTDAKVIIEEVKRLSSTIRGRLDAEERLKNAGEYAIPFMLGALSDQGRKEEFANITGALGKMGKEAIRPLAAALLTDNVAIKAEIIRAMGQIGYPQSLPYLKYVAEKDTSAELGELALKAIERIDPQAGQLPASELFFRLGEMYYNHDESLAPDGEYDFANVWFEDKASGSIVRQEVGRAWFNELMAMRCCEWALKADENIGKAIGLWIAAFFKAESAGIKQPEYFCSGHMNAMNYATTAGAEYLQQALERALADNDGYVALGVVEALAANAGEKSLLYRVGTEQPLVKALSFSDIKVRYSSAIAIGQAGPSEEFVGSKLIIENLAGAIREEGSGKLSKELADAYAVRAIKVMLTLAVTRNSVVDISAALGALTEATKDQCPEMQTLAAQTLARLQSPDAQRAIAAMAMFETNSKDVRLSAFESLSVSAKLNANLLTETQIDALYSLVNSFTGDPEIRTAAASTYGALNLPSRRVKDLILEQSRS